MSIMKFVHKKASNLSKTPLLGLIDSRMTSYSVTHKLLKKSSIDGKCYLVYLWALLVYKIVVLVVL